MRRRPFVPPTHALEWRKRDPRGWFHPDIQKRIREMHRVCPSCLGDLGVPAGEGLDGTPICAKCIPREDRA